ncbi:MAG: hypothetical protein AAFX07_03945 [Pseudomonadota bacterium]
MTDETSIEKSESTELAATSVTPPQVSFSECANGNHQMNIGDNTDDDFERLKAALGLAKVGVFQGFLENLANATSTSQTKPSEMNMRFALGFIHSIDPQNEMEASLAAQMAVTHLATMKASRRFLQSNSLEGQDSAERALNKLARTFTTQMESLKRYQSKAQQVVRVERVTVEEGGQAIVGPVTHGGTTHEK